MKKTYYKRQGGITLIALVITIIVLLILAGVAISMLSGENGILKQAAKSKTETERESVEEGIHLAYLSALTAGNGKVDYGVLNSELAELGFDRGSDDDNDGVYSNDIKSLQSIIKINGKEYTITDGGKSPEAGKWAYKKDSKGRETIVTNGVIELPIGTYINYNAAVKDAEGTIEERSVTSEAGSPYITRATSYKSTEQTITEGNGYGAQIFKNTTDTNAETEDGSKGWRVLGVDEEKGEILIISADPVQTSATTPADFYLCGIPGYQYGEGQLDKVCSVFGNGYGASTVTPARSVDVDDVNKITGFNPNKIGTYDPKQEQTGAPYTEGGVCEYGLEVTFKWNTTSTYGQVDCLGVNNAKVTTTYGYSSYGFNWYDVTEKKWKCNTDTTSTEDITKLKSEYYGYSPITLTKSSSGEEKGISIDSDEYKTLFCNAAGTKREYWLASTLVSIAGVWGPCFNVNSVSDTGFVSSVSLYDSDGFVTPIDKPVRPVVSLKSDIKLQYNSSDAAYDIIG